MPFLLKICCGTADKAAKTEEEESEANWKKKASVSVYSGKIKIHIRTYYRENGEDLPSKAGIALTVEQWQALKDSVSHIFAVKLLVFDTKFNKNYNIFCWNQSSHRFL